MLIFHPSLCSPDSNLGLSIAATFVTLPQFSMSNRWWMVGLEGLPQVLYVFAQRLEFVQVKIGMQQLQQLQQQQLRSQVVQPP